MAHVNSSSSDVTTLSSLFTLKMKIKNMFSSIALIHKGCPYTQHSTLVTAIVAWNQAPL